MRENRTLSLSGLHLLSRSPSDRRLEKVHKLPRKNCLSRGCFWLSKPSSGTVHTIHISSKVLERKFPKSYYQSCCRATMYRLRRNKNYSLSTWCFEHIELLKSLQLNKTKTTPIRSAYKVLETSLRKRLAQNKFCVKRLWYKTQIF